MGFVTCGFGAETPLYLASSFEFPLTRLYVGIQGYIMIYMGIYWYIRVCNGIRGYIRVFVGI